MRIHRRSLLAALALSAAPRLARAEAPLELRIGVGTEPTSMDPHFYNLTPNAEATAEVFDTLVWAEHSDALIPWLAESWSRENDTTWIVKLRQGVEFSDGTPLTADDAIFTFGRVPKVENSPSSYAKYVAHIAAATAPDPHTLRIETKGPYPQLPSDLTQIAIVSRKHGEGAATADYNSGKAVIGTGAYKLQEWVQGDRLVYVRNERYWGQKPVWDRVTVKPYLSPPTRTAAMMSGGVDLINQVSPDDMAELARRPNIRIVRHPEDRLMYVTVDMTRDTSPFVTDKDGKPLDRNPLKIPAVRQAISAAIDRNALVSRIMEGQASQAGDLLPPGDFGTDPALTPDRYDPARAKSLLAAAGFPDGFGLTVHGPNDRYVNDSRIVQAVAQYLSRVGIACKVEVMPKAVYFGQLARRSFSLALVGTSPDLGAGTYSMLAYMLETRDAAGTLGSGNWNHYSNPELDHLIEQARVTFDRNAALALLRQAGQLVHRDLPIIPLIYETNAWAMRDALDFGPRADGYTLAADIRRKEGP